MIVLLESRQSGLAGLDLSLKPPKWVRSIVGAVTNPDKVQAVADRVQGAADSAQVIADKARAAAESLRNAKRSISNAGKRGENPMERANDWVTDNIPGGWSTVIAGGLGLVLVVSLASRKGKR